MTYTTHVKRMFYEMVCFPRKRWDRPLGIVWHKWQFVGKYNRTKYAKDTKRRTGEGRDLPGDTGGL